jgi:hypothetical protein
MTKTARSFSRMLVELTFSGTPVPDPIDTSPEDLISLAAGANGMKLFIRDDGMYRVAYGDFLAGGLDLSFDPQNLKLFRQGAEVPITVIGEEDGSFDPGDSVLFYGKSYSDLYTGCEVYFLLADVMRGRRTSSGLAVPQGAPLSGDFTPATWQDKHYWFFNNARSGMPMEDRWLGPVIMPFGMGYDCTFDLPYAAGAGNATITIPMLPSMDNAGVDPDHHVIIYVNGTPVGEYWFDGRAFKVIEASFDAGLLSTTNVISVQCIWVPGTIFDLIYLSRITLDYPRTWEAEDDRLTVTANLAGTHTAEGFMLGLPSIHDVTDIDNPVRLFGGTHAGSDVTFEAAEDGSYHLSTDAAVRTPDWAVNEPSSLRSSENAYSYVIITHDNFRNAAETLAEHRRSFDGLSVLVTDVANVYDEFSGGRRSPDAIRDFLAYAIESWEIPLEAVLLVGDASADTKGCASGVDRNFVPSYFYDTGSGYSMSDQMLVADESGLPVIAIGRLPVLTAYEAERVVDKITAYDTEAVAGAWSSKILLTADKADDWTPTSDYHAASDTFAAYIPPAYTVDKGYYTGANASYVSVRGQIIDAFTTGALIVNYTGHGAYDVWSSPNMLLDPATMALFPQQPNQPFVIVSNCLTGAIDFPTYRTLAELLLAREGGGAIGVFASAGKTGSSGQFFLNQAIYMSLFSAGERRFGFITRDAVELARSMFVPLDSLRSFNLYGDPMQRLKE